MWPTTTLLFLLLSIGVSIVLTDKIDPKFEAQRFIDRVTRSIASNDVSIISGLFQPAFIFKGCPHKIYNKKAVVKMLSNLPAGTVISSKLKSSAYVRNGQQPLQLRYSVEITGWNEPFTAEFFVSRSDQQLISGRVEHCHELPRVVREEDPLRVVEKFISKVKRESIYADHIAEPLMKNLTAAITSKDAAKIESYFQPGFVFKGCKGEYDKKKTLELLEQAGKNFAFGFRESSHVRCRQIKMEMYITGMGEQFRADLFCNIDEKKLIEGNNPECDNKGDNKERAARSQVPLERAEMEHGLDVARDRMCALDESGLANHFDDKFTLEGCSETVDKATALKHIWDVIDPKDPFEYHVNSARYEVGAIESIVTIKGILGREFTIELHYNPSTETLYRAKSLSCGGK